MCLNVLVRQKKNQSPLEGDCIFQSSPTSLLQKLCTMTNASHLDRLMASWRSFPVPSVG